MTRAVFDVNLLVSGFIGANRAESVPGELLRRWEAGNFDLVLSDHLRENVERVLQRRYFRERVTAEQRRRFDRALVRRAEWTAITETVSGVAPDDEDDLVLATALSANVPYLVTGDAALRRVGSYQGVTILTPREFLALLESGEIEPGP